jgi:hypothetical protein
MSPFVLERDAKLYEWGRHQRGHRNWEKGIPYSRCIQSIFRHLQQYMIRVNDPDHGDCLAAIRFWAGALMHYEELIKRGLLPHALDDMPTYVRDQQAGTDNPVERIYVAGPISGTNEFVVERNYRRGQNIGKILQKKGHLVFVPHNYVLKVPGQLNLPEQMYENLLSLDLSVIRYWATALYFMGSSPGADRELKFARELGLKIFDDQSAVPDLSQDTKSG